MAADHRKNLLSFALGEDGVRLAHKVNDLAAKISDQRKLENDAKAKVQLCISGAMTPEEFSRLTPAGEDAESELASKKSARDAQARIETLNRLQTLSPIEFDDFSIADLQEVLERSLETVSKTAEAQLHAHLSRVHATEEWIEEGESFESGASCPFCGQEIARSEIAPVFSAYFSTAYKEYKQALKSDLFDLQQRVDLAAITKIRSSVESNKSRLLQWSDFLSSVELNFNTDTTVSSLQSARSVLASLADQKLSAPLEAIVLSSEQIAAIGVIKSAATVIDDYNASQVNINEKAHQFRNSVGQGNLSLAEAELCRVQNQISRSSKRANTACDEWKAAISRREKLEADKVKARKELDDQTASILSKYKDSMNVHLRGCGTSYKISTLKTTYSGGTPRCEYGIELLGMPVDLSNKATSAVTFNYALSQGDKNALAFAFFLSRAESDPQRSEKIIIFDDPLSSLDSCRRRYTRTKIAELANHVSQVIMLTHEEASVADFCDRLGEAECSVFELKPHGDYSVFATASAKQLTASEYARSFDKLTHYLHGQGDPEDIVKAIRPYLEMNLRYRFPADLLAEALGSMIKRIRSADTSRPLAKVKPILRDLENINEYCIKHSHGDGALLNDERILESDLRQLVEAAIEIASGFPTLNGR